jgi:hypothetical protein
LIAASLQVCGGYHALSARTPLLPFILSAHALFSFISGVALKSAAVYSHARAAGARISMRAATFLTKACFWPKLDKKS